MVPGPSRASKTLPHLGAGALALVLAGCMAVGAPGTNRPRSRIAVGDGGALSPDDPAETCTEAQAGYDSFVAQTTASLGASQCQEDGDCRLVVINNACSHGCGTAVAARTATAFKSALDDYAATHCTACPGAPDTCPSTERIAYCTGGSCSAH